MNSNICLPLVLGSSSRSRKKILEEHNIKFTVLKPAIDEQAVAPHLRNSPSEYALAVAQAKMDYLISKIDGQSPCIIVASDQVTSWNGQVREKPIDTDECRSFLKDYATAPAETHSGVVVYNTQNSKREFGTDVALQHFKPIPENIIDILIDKGLVMECCGGFMIDDGTFNHLHIRDHVSISR
jgi:septum formation protein